MMKWMIIGSLLTSLFTFGCSDSAEPESEESAGSEAASTVEEGAEDTADAVEEGAEDTADAVDEAAEDATN
jgi:hypothetical protein